MKEKKCRQIKQGCPAKIFFEKEALKQFLSSDICCTDWQAVSTNLVSKFFFTSTIYSVCLNFFLFLLRFSLESVFLSKAMILGRTITIKCETDKLGFLKILVYLTLPVTVVEDTMMKY